MRVLRATHLGMCFGVRDAIALALERADAGPLTIASADKSAGHVREVEGACQPELRAQRAPGEG